jgi:hypothetical protein
MNSGTKTPAVGFGTSRWRGAALTLAVAIGLGGCGDILDVENPNNLVESELSNPASAASLVNGASGTVARGIGGLLGIYSTASDEATLIGSRDGWRELDIGDLANPRNEFTDDAFRYIAQARFTADEAVKRLEGFDAEQKLTDRSDLARAYQFAAIAYITIADMFDDFVFSNGREASPPIGEANMVKLYDTAIGYLDKGLDIAQATNKAELQTQILGLRARAKYSKALWNKLNPKGSIPADPLINDAGANEDAAAALARMSEDFRFVLTLANDDLALAGEASLAYNLFVRRELGLQKEYATLLPSIQVELTDPITGAPDPVLENTLTTLSTARLFQPITIVSAREMRLILAEAALAAGDIAGFTTRINELRALNDLAPFSGQVPAVELLSHSRRVNLFLQGRRLADMYRFNEPSSLWQPTSAAVRTPGTFFPITCIEVRAHPEDFPNVSC